MTSLEVENKSATPIPSKRARKGPEKSSFFRLSFLLLLLWALARTREGVGYADASRWRK